MADGGFEFGSAKVGSANQTKEFIFKRFFNALLLINFSWKTISKLLFELNLGRSSGTPITLSFKKIFDLLTE